MGVLSSETPENVVALNCDGRRSSRAWVLLAAVPKSIEKRRVNDLNIDMG